MAVKPLCVKNETQWQKQGFFSKFPENEATQGSGDVWIGLSDPNSLFLPRKHWQNSFQNGRMKVVNCHVKNKTQWQLKGFAQDFWKMQPREACSFPRWPGRTFWCSSWPGGVCEYHHCFGYREAKCPNPECVFHLAMPKLDTSLRKTNACLKEKTGPDRQKSPRDRERDSTKKNVWAGGIQVKDL